MQDFGSSVLLATPSYALNLADAMAELGVDPKTEEPFPAGRDLWHRALE